MITSRRAALAGIIAGATLPFSVSGNAPTCLSVKSFGAIGDGITDDTAAIQRVIDAASSMVYPLPGGSLVGTQIYFTGATVYFPRGTYFVSSTLIISSPAIGFLGDGHSQSIVYRSGDYGDTILLSPNPVSATPLEGISIQDLGFLATHPAPTSGAHINMTVCYEATLHNLRLLGHYGGISLTACSNVSASNIRMGSGYLNWSSIVVGSYFLKISAMQGVKFNPQPSTIFFSNFNFQGGSPSLPFMQYGILVDNCDLAHFVNGYCGSVNNAALIVSPTTNSDVIDNLHFTNVEFDGNFERSMYGVVVTNPNGGIIKSVNFDSCNFVNANIGVYVDLVNSGSVRITGGLNNQNSGVGAYLVSGNDISIRGTTLQSNGQNIVLGGGTLEDIRIQDNYIAQTGILVNGTVSRAIISGNNFRDAAISGTGLGTDSVIVNNTEG